MWARVSCTSAASGAAMTAYSMRWQARRRSPSSEACPCTSEHLVDAAGERHPLAGLLGARRGQQVVGLAVVPAAVEPPDVAHDELRMVVDRPQVRLVEQVRRHLDLVQHAVERRARVHQRQRLRSRATRAARRCRCSAVRTRAGAEDRQAVAGQQRLGAERRPSRAAPPPTRRGVALHLLRVAGVRRRPDEEVARVRGSCARAPTSTSRRRSRRGRGAARTSGRRAERQRGRVRDVGVAVLLRPAEARRPGGELALVDRRVPAERLLVAVEVRRQPGVPVDDAAAASASRSLPRSNGPTPKTWSTWWCENTAARAAHPGASAAPRVQSVFVSNTPPVSSITSPSPVSMVLTLAIPFRNRTPSAISSPVRCVALTGWSAKTRSPCPCHRRSESSLMVPTPRASRPGHRPALVGHRR